MAKITKAQAATKIERYLKLKERIKRDSEEADALKAELKELAEANETRAYTVNDHAVIVTTATRSTINVKELAAAHPKIAAKFTKETWYDTVRIK